MKFWQKTFILTLALFLVCFGSGIFALAVFFNGQLVENCENTCLAEQFYIAKSFASDCEYTASTGGSVKELMMSYSEYYFADGISLAIEYDGIRNEQTDGELAQIAFSEPLSEDEEERIYFQRRVNGARYIFIKSKLAHYCAISFTHSSTKRFFINISVLILDIFCAHFFFDDTANIAVSFSFSCALCAIVNISSCNIFSFCCH